MLPSMECYDCYLLLQRCFPELLLLDRAGCARRPEVPVLALVQVAARVCECTAGGLRQLYRMSRVIF